MGCSAIQISSLFQKKVLPALLFALLGACGGGGGGGNNTAISPSSTSSSSSSNGSANSGSAETGSGSSSSSSNSSSGGASSSSSSSGGSIVAASGTLGSCLDLKPGVKYVSRNSDPRYMEETTHEFLIDSFEGQTAIAEQETHVSLVDTPTSTFRTSPTRSYYRLTSLGLESLGQYTYESILSNGTPGTITGKYVDRPALITSISLSPGQLYSLAWQTIETSYPDGKTSTYDFGQELEFLGFEDVTLGNGMVVKNACKTRVTTMRSSFDEGDVGSYGISWLAAGWSVIKSEEYDKTGKLLDSSIITKVIVAP